MTDLDILRPVEYLQRLFKKNYFTCFINIESWASPIEKKSIFVTWEPEGN